MDDINEIKHFLEYMYKHLFLAVDKKDLEGNFPQIMDQVRDDGIIKSYGKHSYRLTEKGLILLTQMRTNESLDRLDKSIKEFSKSSNEHNKYIKEHNKSTSRLNLLMLTFTTLIVMVTIFQILDAQLSPTEIILRIVISVVIVISVPFIVLAKNLKKQVINTVLVIIVLLIITQGMIFLGERLSKNDIDLTEEQITENISNFENDSGMPIKEDSLPALLMPSQKLIEKLK